MLDQEVHLEQVITYAPADNLDVHGSEVSKSENVGQRMAQTLLENSPNRTQLKSNSSEALSFFQVEGRFALSRTAIGQAENLAGRRLIISRTILFRHDQLARFNFHIGNILFLLQTSGYLTIPLNRSARLPELSLNVPTNFDWNHHSLALSAQTLETVERALGIHHQIALTGVIQMGNTLSQIFDYTPPEQRLNLSFSSGFLANPSNQFALQLFHDSNTEQTQSLARYGRRTIALGPDDYVSANLQC